MNEIQDYSSKLSDPASRRFETFSYLPPLTKEELRAQIDYIIKRGWNPAVEHTEPEHVSDSFWYMWKLPMFGETDTDRVLNEIESCHKLHPTHHVRLIGYDNLKQSQGASMVVVRGKTV
jgi:ribulose-bisphosphate carboxylase small chain